MGESTIVLVEDDGSIADLVDMYMRQAGFRVVQATTGERGLALVKEHVSLHGGRVFVTDRLDSQPGARFVVELPVVTGEEEEPEVEELPPAAVLVSDLVEEQQS